MGGLPGVRAEGAPHPQGQGEEKARHERLQPLPPRDHPPPQETQAHKYKDQPKIAFKDAVAMWEDVSPSRKDEYAARIKDMFGDTARQTIEGTATKKRKGGRR